MKFRKFCLFIFLFISSCNFFRPLLYNFPNQSDVNKFYSRKIEAADNIATFNFYRSLGTQQEIKNLTLENKGMNSTNVSLNSFVALHNTISMAIIRNDSILYEKYASDYNHESSVASFSVAKAYVTMLVGIAIHDGLIKNVNQPITDFIGEWKGKSSYDKITIRHLLVHTSGLRLNTSKTGAMMDESTFYYANNLREDILKCKIVEEPGIHFDYENENTSLLGLILERVTQKTLSSYLEEKIWRKIGTESGALWSTDRDDLLAIEKSFCCINARTIDFAKFARLLLKKGNWDGEQIIPAGWIEEATSSAIELGEKPTYGYNLGLGPKEYGSYFAIGLYGQILYIYPKKNLIIVRFGNTDINYNPNYWKEIMLQISDQL
jgi:CubicO group peptidase (beta-lactamase class C family)